MGERDRFPSLRAGREGAAPSAEGWGPVGITIIRLIIEYPLLQQVLLEAFSIGTISRLHRCPGWIQRRPLGRQSGPLANP